MSTIKDRLQAFIDAVVDETLWDETSYKGGSLLSFKMEHIERFDPPAVFSSKLPEWKFFWKGKDKDDFTFAIGSCLFLPKPNSEELKSLRGYKLFGGLPFAEKAQLSSEWGIFSKEFYVLPSLEFSFERDRVSLSANIFVNTMDQFQEEAEKLARLIFSVYEESARNNPKEFPELLASSNYPSYEHWLSTVNLARDKMEKADFDKVVLSRSQVFSFVDDVDVGKLLISLSEISEPSFLFAFGAPSGETFIGRSPERLISWDDGLVFVDAIAGTRKRSNLPSEDGGYSVELAASAKDLHEHRVVTDVVKSRLSNFCVNVDQFEKEKLFKLKNLHHIRSKFKATLNADVNPIDLMKQLHPTPAVGGRPKVAAVSFIDQYEMIDRGWFAGAIGYTEGGKGDFAIGIRTAYVKNNCVSVYAGAGIVRQSDAHLEWEETQVKMKNFYDLFVKDPEDWNEYEAGKQL